MRTASLCLLALAGGFAHADRAVFVPTGRKLLPNTAKFEFLDSAGRSNTFGWLQYSPNSVFEFSVYGEKLAGQSTAFGVNGSFTFVNPITDVAPGISLGFLDIANETEDGRALYAAITYRLGNEGLLNQFLPTDITLGVWSRERSLGFAAAELPFSDFLSVVGELDGNGVTAGVNLSPVKGARIRLLWTRGDPTFGFQFQQRF